MVSKPVPKTYEEFRKQYIDQVPIPDSDLYEYINSEAIRSNVLAAQTKLGKDFAENPLVKEVRKRCKTDLFWFAKYFLWDSNPEGAGRDISFNKMTEATHRPLCDMFVKKDDHKTLEHQDDVCKERLILYPRGSMKSTIDLADVSQWILNFPEIRLLLYSSVERQVIKFLDEVKGHFVIRTNKPSLMNLFFPEYCLEEKDLGPFDKFTCPLWASRQIIRGEPTVYAASLGSTVTGFHFEVIKIDDAVDDKNSENEDQCKKVIKQVSINMKMLMPYGYKDVLGTRYADEEMYGELINKNVGTLEVISGLDLPDPRPWTLTINKDTGLKVLIGKGWQLTKTAEKDILDNKLKEEDVKQEHYHILFPENLPYGVLRRMEKEDEVVFEGQINQNPRPKSTIVFDRPLLLKHTVPYNELPTSGPISITWDFAFSTKRGRDYSTGVVGQYNNKSQLFIIDLVRARLNQTALAKAVVDLAEKYRPVVIGIEDVAGSKYMESAILMEANRRGKPEVLNMCARIDWFKPDMQKDAKKSRMASLHPLLTSDRLFFSAHLPYIEPLYSEFERCLTSHNHDDIPDGIAHQLRYAPRMQTMVAKNEFPTGSLADIAWNVVFDGSAELYGEQGPGNYTSPLDNGLLLMHNPETGQLQWVSKYVTPPVDLTPAVEPPPDRPPGMEDSMLGAGIFG